ncbi:T9SS type A sorting domain-containing protein, partial [Candidatus Eisenbacteria bacterium]
TLDLQSANELTVTRVTRTDGTTPYPGVQEAAPPPSTSISIAVDAWEVIILEYEVAPPTSDVPTNTQGTGTLSLSVPAPNPLSLRTAIRVGLPRHSSVRLDIHDSGGRWVNTVFDGMLEAGFHDLSVDTSDLPPGVYFLRLNTGQDSRTQKLVVLR